MKSLDEIKARSKAVMVLSKREINATTLAVIAGSDIPRLCEAVEYLMRKHINQLPDDYRVMIKEVDRILGGEQ